MVTQLKIVTIDDRRVVSVITTDIQRIFSELLKSTIG